MNGAKADGGGRTEVIATSYSIYVTASTWVP